MAQIILCPFLAACGALQVEMEGVTDYRMLVEVGVEAPTLTLTPTPLPRLAPAPLPSVASRPIAILTVTPTPTSISILSSIPGPTSPVTTHQPTASPTSEATVAPPTPSATPTTVTSTFTPTSKPSATNTPVPPTVAPANTPTATVAPLLQVLSLKVIYHDAESENSEGVAFYQTGVEPWLDLLVLLGDNHWYGPERQADEIVAAPLPPGYRWETDSSFSSAENGEGWWNHNGNEGQARLYYGDTLLSQRQLRIEFMTSGGGGNKDGNNCCPTIE